MNIGRLLVGVMAVSLAGTVQLAHGQDRSQRDRAATDPRVVAAGAKLFRRNCAACHGWNAEGTVADWREPGPDGKMPPPPLNGTAHTWHHPRSGLMLAIRQGTVRIGGNMPAWKGKLSDAQISATIDYLISLWPEEVYQAWLKRGGYK
jgi:mono/diheme cytochrome c family protein